jgi:hypothetical protein
MAEREGFEPSVPCGTLVFETSQFNHSCTSPYSSILPYLLGQGWYNTPMKVWRGFTLTIWVALLAACTAFALLYYALNTTVLNADKTKERLVSSKAYDTIRDTLLVNQVVNSLSEQYPDNRLIDRPMISEILAAALPRETLAKRLDPAVSNIYRWLDSKEEDISFSITVVDKKDTFYQALEPRLAAKLTAIDSCGDYRYPPEEAVLKDLCLPVYVTAKEATQAAMGSIRAGDFPLGDTITEETLLGPKADRGAFRELPTYLNILWTLNLVALAVGGVLALFLAITRKSTGFIAAGIGLIVGGVAAWIAGPVITSLVSTVSQSSPLTKALLDVFVAPFTASVTSGALLTILGGGALVGLAFAWRWYRGRRA